MDVPHVWGHSSETKALIKMICAFCDFHLERYLSNSPSNVSVLLNHRRLSFKQGEICVDKFCRPGCHTNLDCKDGESCNGGKCGCSPGYVKTPTGCQDVDECQDRATCPAGMNCQNLPGSFECKCPLGKVGDVNSGCRSPDECSGDSR